ncbi:hypothetical protein DFH07DRAFT_911481 [Mycena maculata]|uniref:Uncharacterized protein n=1 Tax=Mycena maculata TaxID=230809 RepID=A0AAD7K3H9_9AGAR|nr:hypothetical protein DFH07DRAFT_911481 [Mycena maculata]
MFEDVCLSCGREVTDGRAYCNDFCQSGDLTSPSLSSVSSAFSSPHFSATQSNGYVHDVPALVPSALGRALRAYSTSSSSASVSSWSVVTDEDEVYSEYDVNDLEAQPSSHGLSYARRPSVTNNRSMFGHLHRRTSSVSVCLPQSAPGDSFSHHSFLGDNEDEYAESVSAAEDLGGDTITPSGPRRKRNRASLPAYFSILTTSPAVPVSPGPATSTALAPAHPSHPGAAASPHSSSSGHSNTLTLPLRDGEDKGAGRADALFLPGRGRTVRRNSSPPAQVLLLGDSERSGSRRGRARVEELNGPRGAERPGYGSGRSGLVERARRGGGEGDTW